MSPCRFSPFGSSVSLKPTITPVLPVGSVQVSGLGYIDKDAKADQKEITLVRLRSLDSMIPEYPELLRTALLKCDVEGYELFVLQGAEHLISRARPVVILEIGNYQKQGYSPRDDHEYFSGRNYAAFAMVTGGGLPLPMQISMTQGLWA